ncbi:SPOR domain-containing protein [Roseinatronobacter alkalisoli]|uniref:SPOR domain-containing protein n=1 Tax=Roseinatronobacter alkalisoli TaxID=3028235 RepID=A0ABT5T7X6_9RHOB|nr:SPOR domain-containing protein [Roseinatronobacter sp. HJB301]MDD7971232.1 SPOR domain-containing protein [Roseinatronobacter sp. HJB301]
MTRQPAPGYAPVHEPARGYAPYPEHARPYAPGPAHDLQFHQHAPYHDMPRHAAHQQVPLSGGGGHDVRMRPKAVVHALGAVTSLALVVAAGIWTWQLMQRDVSGVPVVRALEGPSRVAPENPGGRQAAFQGLSINELAAAGEVENPDSIVLAPPPTGLGANDIDPRRADQGQPAATDNVDEMVPVPVALQRDVPETSSAPLGFVSPNRLAVSTSPRPPARGQAVQVAAAAPRTQPQAQAPAPTVSSSSSDADAIAASVAAGLSSPRGLDVDPASIGPGTRLVQLGAYDDAPAARAAWDQLARRFSPLLDDRGRVIEAAHSGGSVFYRLRAHGFEDERDARRFCAALVAQNIDCIPVLVR